MNDLILLRKYEPILRLTQGESYFPSGVAEYVKECSLWMTNPQGEDRMLVAQGQLDLENLSDYAEVPYGHTLHLRFVETPLDAIEYSRWLRDPDRSRFVAPSRLARVPLLYRLASSLFDLSFLVRGQVPGGNSAAAELKSRAIRSRDPRCVYFGRVIQSGGWIALQYIFFYPMNNWRSGFYGVNDHEADWEQVFIFLYQAKDAEPKPRWVAYASHDFKGDDLRRRWDDPLLVKQGDHPVIFTGAGSHASYFEQGEYLMGAEPDFLMPAKGALIALRKFWTTTLGMGSEKDSPPVMRTMFTVPFIDYARGDGLSVGPGQDQEWEPEIISDEVAWVNNYRGLWGLDTHDPVGGERAPAGPKYNRDGTVRQSWYDPFGWAGLDKVSPPNELPNEILNRSAELESELQIVEKEISRKRESTRKVALDVDALKKTEYTSALYKTKEDTLKLAQDELHMLQTRRVEMLEIQQAIRTYRLKVEQGDLGSPDAHIHQVHHPEPQLQGYHRAVEIWAALSNAVILLIILLLVILQPEHWFTWLIGLGVVFAGIEATIQQRLTDYLLNIIIILAVISAFILLVEFWRWIISFALIGLIMYTILGNLREIRH
jgi:hypothetical protein